MAPARFAVMKRLILAVLIVLGTGCVCVSPEQAVNVSELHDGVVRLMPWADKGIRAEINTQSTIASDSSRTQGERDEASKIVVELTGRLMETKLLPAVSEPIRDWTIAKVGSDAFLKAKKDRDTQIAGGSNGSH